MSALRVAKQFSFQFSFLQKGQAHHWGNWAAVSDIAGQGIK